MPGIGQRRTSGVLAHVSSLPSGYGIGDIAAGRRFVDFLHRAGQRWWQILPLNPISTFLGSSPYSSQSLFAGNPLLISPEMLAADGWLGLADIGQGAPGHEGPVNFEAVETYKTGLLDQAFERAEADLQDHPEFEQFCLENGPLWLDDYAAFCVLKDRHHGAAWDTWPEAEARHSPDVLAALESEDPRALLRIRFIQFLFFHQWAGLRGYCRDKGVGIIGDLPFYPTFDSADVWAHPELFQLDAGRRMTVVAGVPPDYFSKTGQRWGNPVYDWSYQAQNGFQWWIKRLEQNLLLVDVVRLDHFRAFSAYWVVPPVDETAENGWWVDGPGQPFFEAVARRFPEMPFIAEDLGLITEDVVRLRREAGLPGMHVLQFGFDSALGESVNALHNHESFGVAYSGTHDNNTARGWFIEDMGEADRQRLAEYLGHRVGVDEASRTLVRLALMSTARVALIPLQDLLDLGPQGRMNTPASPEGNWAWRAAPRELNPRLADRLRHWCKMYGRNRTFV